VALGWALGAFSSWAPSAAASSSAITAFSWLGPQQRKRAAEQQRQLRDQQAAKQTDEGLLADVDTDVSREVPSALEPLAQMMNDDETR